MKKLEASMELQKTLKPIEHNSPPSTGMSLESQDSWPQHMLGYFHTLHLKTGPLWDQQYCIKMALNSLDNSDGMI